MTNPNSIPPTPEDNNKTITLDPMRWGRQFWETLEAIACTMTDKKRKHIISMIQELQHLLPCDTCKKHFQEYIKLHPFQKHMKDPIDFLRWIYELQCTIKERQNRECETFQDYIDRVVECFDVPVLYQYLDQEQENKNCPLNIDQISLLDAMPEYYYPL